MNRIIVTGIGTDVGKTLASSVLAVALHADYWKPIQCGEEAASDTAQMKQWLDPSLHHIHHPAYFFKEPCSPHKAARLNDCEIKWRALQPPKSDRPIIIEGIGGALVPLTNSSTSLDLFPQWGGKWVVVSRHYLGSINHTLLTLNVLKERGVHLAGLIFNGEPCPDSEEAILTLSQLPLLGRLLPENTWNQTSIQRYAKQWQPSLSSLLA